MCKHWVGEGRRAIVEGGVPCLAAQRYPSTRLVVLLVLIGCVVFWPPSSWVHPDVRCVLLCDFDWSVYIYGGCWLVIGLCAMLVAVCIAVVGL